MFEGEIIFYNGFNLGVDILIFTVTAYFWYRFGKRDGYIQGYGEGEADYRDRAEKHADYLFDRADTDGARW
jgi:hypothetical protein